MGVSLSKSINNILTKIIDELEKTTGANATNECNINVGKIIVTDHHRCTVSNQNRCSSNSIAALNAIVRAATNAWMDAPPQQKKLLIPGINIYASKDKIQDKIKTLLQQKCPENSAMTESISNTDLIIDRCEGINIININAGTAVANCAIRTIIKTIIAADIEKRTIEGSTQSPFSTVFGSLGISSALSSASGFLSGSSFLIIIIMIIFLIM
jgi:hypothetical protein